MLCCQEHHGPCEIKGPIRASSLVSKRWWRSYSPSPSQLSFLHLLYKTGTTTASFTGYFSHTIIFCHPKLIKDTHDKNSEKKLESPTSPRRNTILHQGLLIVHIKQNCQMFEKHILEQLLPYLSNTRTRISHAGPEEASNAPSTQELGLEGAVPLPQHIPYPVPCSASQRAYSRPKAMALPSPARRSGLAQPTASHFPITRPRRRLTRTAPLRTKENKKNP